MDAAVSPSPSFCLYRNVGAMATWETPASQPTQTCRSFRRAGTQPTATVSSSSFLYNPHAAASSIPSSNHPSCTTRPVNTEPTAHPDPISGNFVRRRERSIFSWRANKPMAVVAGGGVVLNLRVPSASSRPAMRRSASSPAVRCGATREKMPAAPGRGLEEDHYRTLSLAPGATRGEVKKPFHRLALEYHPDVVGQESSIDFQRINVAYQTVMSNMREAEATLEYWRQRYGLADEDLDRYRRYLNDEDEDDWFADL